MHATYDAVIVGGGHNGLTAAAYLARAGRTVLLLERADHWAARRSRRGRSRGWTRTCRATPTSSRSCPDRSATSSGCASSSAAAGSPPTRPPATAWAARGHGRRRRDRRLVRVGRRRRRRRRVARVRRPHRRARRAALPDDDRAAAVARRRPPAARCGRLARPGRAAGRRGGRRDVRLRPGPRGRADGRPHRHVRPRPRDRRPAEPVLPLSRDRRRDRGLGRAGRGAWVRSRGRSRPRRDRRVPSS